MRYTVLLCFLLVNFLVFGQRRSKTNANQPSDSPLTDLSITGLKFRSVGPAITSGRISDFAVNEANPKEYYVATSAGGVWKTVNAGATYQPLFDGEGSYSTGVVTIDPNNPNVIWVGSGENNNQRSVSYGDGIYKSIDGGSSWKNMGLKSSEHIGSVIVDPDNSERIYVAAIGPLWSSGGERGIYVSEDGGQNWKNTLSIDAHTGVNEIVMDPLEPNVLYASTLQRRRHVFTYIGGGPGSSIYKSTDRGESWEKIDKGLPEVDLGRIGLAISPANPEIIYAIVEAAQGKGGFYRSTNRGASWDKMSSFSTSGNYYQEIVADPKDPDKIYAMDTWIHISTDGGKSFKVLGEDTKHVDNHCMWIDPSDTDHLLVGCDGGIYETFDVAKTWLYKPNLPVTQFYKVALDNAEPFYNIYGGTQDNFSMGGPSRSISGNGIANSEWYMTHGGDGFESQVDPNNPDIVYAQSQYGFLVRYDRKSGEEVGIKPQPRKDELSYRWNWDAPLHVSAHNPTRIYFSANKVFKSDDRGNTWEVISDDLTAQINRNELEVMGRVWGIDAIAKNQGTSPYGTIVAFHESPLNEDILVVGTDDGLIQITSNGGESWRRISGIPGVPNRTYVNFVLTSQHDENVIYAAFNHHKYGDFKPYIYKSSDLGATWSKMSNNLPDRGSVYALAEDHVNPNLLFAGTEFGVFFSPNGGNEWKQLKSGLPTIAVRDIAIHPRENDLVLGTFGRGFYVLDDYSSLRGIDQSITAAAKLMPVRDPWQYVQKYPLGLPGKSFQGDNYYLGENLGPVAMFTYYLKEPPKTKEAARQAKEKDSKAAGRDNAYPNYEALKAEKTEADPYLLFTVKNSNGDIVRKLTTKPEKGLNRVHWDLRFGYDDPIDLAPPAYYNPFGGTDEGTLIAPGEYSVSLSMFADGEFTDLDGPTEFTVNAVDNTVLPAQDRDAKLSFQRKVSELYRQVSSAEQRISELNSQLKHMEEAILLTETDQKALFSDFLDIKNSLADLQYKFSGDPVASTLDIDKIPTVSERVGLLNYEQFNTTSSPTQTHLRVYEIANEEFAPMKKALTDLIQSKLAALETKLEAAGAPYTPYRLGN